MLSGNCIFDISNFMHFPNLKALDVSDNEITEIPSEIGKLTKLELLSIRENQIPFLPKALGNLQSLNTLVRLKPH